MSFSRRRIVASGSAFLFALTAALFAGTGVAHAATADEAARAGSQIRYLGEHTYPDVYAGVAVDELAGTLTLQVTAPGSAADALAAAAGSVPVVAAVVSRSFQDLMSLQQQVIGDDALWTAQGALLTDIGPDFSSNRLTIGVQDWSDTIAAAMALRYGEGNILVVQQAAGEGLADRSHDTAPYNGGDTLRAGATSGGYCTTGFGVHYTSSAIKNTGPYLITAGHCFGNGAIAYHNGAPLGTVYRSSTLFKDYGHDVEMIGVAGKSSRSIWETNTARAQSDGIIMWPAIGTSLCRSGAATDKRCGTVADTNHCYFMGAPTNLHFCDQDKVTSSSLLGARGDSGGPWFDAYTSNGIRKETAVGLTSIGWGSGYTCNTQLGSNTCYKTLTYSQIGDLVSDYAMWVNY